uniref:Ras and Rab interactor 3 n=1 Tax=Crocodylus porosus TaxID=8502 RepID=A0A7M4ELN1_CROPO
MMKTSAGDEGVREDSGSVTDTGEGNDKTQLDPPVALRNCFPLPGISILDKLIKTCPIWLQLSMNEERAREILSKEMAGIFLVRKEGNMNNMVLSFCYPSQNEAPDMLQYNIKEEKSSFWDSSLNHRRRRGGISQAVKDSAFSTTQTDNIRSSQHFASDTNQCSCEIELSIGNDRLWFVNPIFIEECSNPFPPDVPPPKSCSVSSELSHAITTTLSLKKSPRRPPPPPPHGQVLKSSKKLSKVSMTACEDNQLLLQPPGKSPTEMKTEGNESMEEEGKEPCSSSDLPPAVPKKCDQPSIPPRRRLSERLSQEPCVDKSAKCETPQREPVEEQHASVESKDNRSVCLTATEEPEGVAKTQAKEAKPTEKECMPQPLRNSTAKGKVPPIPPPRKKRLSQQASISISCNTKSVNISAPDTSAAETSSKDGLQPAGDAACSDTQDALGACCKSSGSFELKGSLSSLDCPGSSAAAHTSASEPDSYSTSSTEDDFEQLSSPCGKKTRSVILDKAKHRLSFVSLTNVFTVFLSANRKLQKKIVELSQDKDSYFGNLVQDYRVYSLEMMAKQSSSTEMLQEIRLMMTQLKSYLVQSTELKALLDPSVYSEEQIEVIVESALYKCVLKPLKDAIDSYLREIHTKDGVFQLLKENQLVIQSTTTTDLGITTSVPETAVLEKIIHKFTTMHKAYSPEKKIAILLKSCKLIYDSMAQGNPGKPYGADDFLPVLMYVLARSNLTEVLLNVEYVMELMDPALQLGEGSYYLTTTYGALEHIKNYDKITVTRQLSVEVQDSIHRWERRRTLNKARASRSSVQDFISISFMEPESQTRTLASRNDTTTLQLGQQCAEKFEVSDPQDYGLFVEVDNRCLQLADDAFPHHIKSYLLKFEPKKDFHFIYKAKASEETQVLVIKEPDFL